MAKSTPRAPRAKLIYSRSVDTALGPRDVRLYWGDVATVPQKHAVVIVSSIVYQPLVTGQAWRAVTARFPKQLEKTELEFQTVLECGPDSSLWPPSPQLQAQWAKLSADPKFRPPSVLVSRPIDHPKLRRVFVLRTLPHRQSHGDMRDYELGLRACFSALGAQELADLVERAEHPPEPALEAEGGDPHAEPYGQIVLSPIAAEQGYPLAELMQAMMSEGARWLKASPRWSSVDIAYWSADEPDEKEARERLLAAIGDEKFQVAEGAAVAMLFEELRKRVDGTLQALPRGKKHDELRHALQELRVTLQRDDPTVTEIGTSSGRLAEALVNWLSAQLKMARPKDFHTGIEALGTRSSKSGKRREQWLSQWFKSYLHTLRILRNESAHSQSAVDRGGQFPVQLHADDLTVLAASLKRVLTLQEKMLRPDA